MCSKQVKNNENDLKIISLIYIFLTIFLFFCQVFNLKLHKNQFGQCYIVFYSGLLFIIPTTSTQCSSQCSRYDSKSTIDPQWGGYLVSAICFNSQQLSLLFYPWTVQLLLVLLSGTKMWADHTEVRHCVHWPITPIVSLVQQIKSCWFYSNTIISFQMSKL